MTTYRLYLTSDERQTLESWVKKGKHSSKKIQSAQILLNSDENVGRLSSTLLKNIIGVSVKTIERVRRQFSLFFGTSLLSTQVFCGLLACGGGQ